MEDERQLILRLIEEGKVTAAEGGRLLDALEAGRRSSPEEVGEKIRAGIEERMERIAEGLRRSGQGLGETWRRHGPDTSERLRQVGTQVRSAVRAAMRSSRLEELAPLRDLFSQVGWMGARHEAARSFEGTLPDADVLPVRVETNGKITVRTWDRPGYRVQAGLRVGALTKERAEERADEAVSVRTGEDGLAIDGRRSRDVIASFTIDLPAGRSYSLDLHAVHGAVEIERLEGGDIEAETVNGRVRLQTVTGGRINLATTNGSIRLADVKAGDHLAARTVNGRIRAEAAGANMRFESNNGSLEYVPFGSGAGAFEHMVCEMRTSNGSGHVELPADLSHAARLEGKTRHGRLSVEGEGLRIIEQVADMGNRRLVAQTNDYESTQKRIEIRLTTSHGSISVTRALDDQTSTSKEESDR